MANVNLDKEDSINVNLSNEKPVETQLQDLNYIPAYKDAEKTRRENEEKRIANETERQEYYKAIQDRVAEGGLQGPPNIISIGTVVSGEEASATIEGKSPNQVLNLVLPKGDKGDRGPKGENAPVYTAGNDIEITDNNVINNKTPVSLDKTKNSINVGDGLFGDNINSVTIGRNNQAWTDVVVIGNNAVASSHGVAIGSGASTSQMVSSIAIGKNAVATKIHEAVFGSSDFNINELNLYTSEGKKAVAFKGDIGIPSGGTTGQVLAKKSNSNNDTEWIDPPEGTGGSSVTVVDNLNSTSSTDALSARQGKLLDEKIQDVYSSEEVKTNKIWVDENGNKKPVYRKKIYWNMESGTAWISFYLNEVGITNYDYIYFAEGSRVVQDNKYVKNIDNNDNVYINIPDNRIVACQMSLSKKYTLVIEYTKTTD